jgi:CRISPR-associated protein Cas5a/b/c
LKGQAPLLAYALVRPQWGFTVRQAGAAAAQLAYLLPPPTTVAGAFAASLARLLGIPDVAPQRGRRGRPAEGLPVVSEFMQHAIAATLAAGAGLPPASAVGVAVFQEPMRLSAAIYKRGSGDYRSTLGQPIVLAAAKFLPVQAVGSASQPGGLLMLAWLVDAHLLASRLGGGEAARMLEGAAWLVYRLGSREGIVEVLDAGVVEPGLVDEGDTFESILYQPGACARPEPGYYTARLTLPGPDYSLATYHAPAGPGSGATVVTPPLQPVAFRVEPRCRAAVASVETRAGRLPLGLAYRG